MKPVTKWTNNYNWDMKRLKDVKIGEFFCFPSDEGKVPRILIGEQTWINLISSTVYEVDLGWHWVVLLEPSGPYTIKEDPHTPNGGTQ